MLVQVFSSGPLQVNCYIIGDTNSNAVFIIDPGGCVKEIRKFIKTHSLKVEGVVTTHGHFDHVDGVAESTSLYKVDYQLHPNDVPLLDYVSEQAKMFGLECKHPGTPGRLITHGDRLQIGESEYRIIHTPGHSPGSICLYNQKQSTLFSGDTLFRESIGRTDLPGGNHEKLINSIRTHLLILPEDTVVYPGHGPISNIAHELTQNPFL